MNNETVGKILRVVIKADENNWDWDRMGKELDLALYQQQPKEQAEVICPRWIDVPNKGGMYWKSPFVEGKYLTPSIQRIIDYSRPDRGLEAEIYGGDSVPIKLYCEEYYPKAKWLFIPRPEFNPVPVPSQPLDEGDLPNLIRIQLAKVQQSHEAELAKLQAEIKIANDKIAYLKEQHLKAKAEAYKEILDIAEQFDHTYTTMHLRSLLSSLPDAPKEQEKK
jgi:hypothetical protein